MNINDRLFGSPISGRVRAELEKRQQSLSGGTDPDSPYQSLSDTIKTPKYDLSERTPFVRMWTSVKLIDPGVIEEKIEEFEFEKNAQVAAKKINEKFERKNNPVVVKPIYDEDDTSTYPIAKKYGVFDENVRDRVEFASKTYIIGDHNYQESYGSVSPTDSINYGYTLGQGPLAPSQGTTSEGRPIRDVVGEVLPDKLSKNPLLKPQAGITSVTSETQELLGVIKKTTVNFVVHNFYDFDRIYNRYFLKPGATIFVDFGWSDIDNLYNPEELINAPNIKEFLYGVRRGIPGYEDSGLVGDSKSEDGVVTKNEGKLEVLQGLVTDYTSRVLPNGSVECTVTITSTNTALLSQKIPNALQTNIMNTLREGSVYLGIIPIIEQFIESEEEQEALKKYLLTPNKSDSYENYEDFEEAISQLSKLDSLEGNFVPRGNSVRTGVYVNSLNNVDNVYVTWGFIEDVILNEKFGFGKDKDDINNGNKLNVRFDSSNSFTHFTNKQIEKQSSLGELTGQAAPEYLYPGVWGNNLVEERKLTGNEDIPWWEEEPLTDEQIEIELNNEFQERNSRGAGSRTFQKGKYPKDFYNKSDNHTSKDKELARIPIREIFINVEVIKNAFGDADNVKQFVENLLYFINEASGKDLKLFDWKLVSGGSGSELKVVDNNKVDTFRRVKDSGIEKTTAEEEQNIFFNSLFTFNIMSPNSIVKEYNLEFNLPSGDIGNMYAIQAMSHDNKILPTNNSMDDAVAMSAMDKSSLSIVYQPDMSGHRAEQMSTDDLKQHNQGKDKNIEKLISSDIYDVSVVRPKNPLPDLQFSSQQEPVLGNELEPGASGFRLEPKNEDKIRNEIIDTNTEYLNSLGFRVEKDLESYFDNQLVIQKDVSIMDRPNLLPFTLSLTIYGISTIQPGDIFRVDYLPQIYQKNVFLQTMNVSHNVNSDGWFTTISAQFRPLPSIKRTHYVDLVNQAKPYLSPTFIMSQHSNIMYLKEFYSVSEAENYGPDGNTWYRPSNKEKTISLLDIISEAIYIEPIGAGYSTTDRVAYNTLNYDYIKNIYKFQFRKKLQNERLQKILFEEKKGIYNIHYSIPIAPSPIEPIVNDYIMMDQYAKGYLKKPVVLEPEKTYYLIINIEGVSMISDEEGVKKENLKYFDVEPINLHIVKGEIQELNENISELELRIQEDVLYLGEINIYEYEDYLRERGLLAATGTTDQIKTLDRVWNNPELVSGGKKTSVAGKPY